MDKRGRETSRGKFVNSVCATVKEEWKSDCTVEKWNVMKSALWEAADSVLGHGYNTQNRIGNLSRKQMLPYTIYVRTP